MVGHYSDQLTDAYAEIEVWTRRMLLLERRESTAVRGSVLDVQAWAAKRLVRCLCIPLARILIGVYTNEPSSSGRSCQSHLPAPGVCGAVHSFTLVVSCLSSRAQHFSKSAPSGESVDSMLQQL